jgi:SanA protein
MEAVGYNARDVGAYSGFRTRVREKAARVKVFLDLAFGKGPRFLGDPVTIE